MAKTRKTPKERSLERLVSERYFDGLPVIDATENLRIFVDAADISKAERLNPNNCIFARACKRLYGSRAIVFLRTKAYVDLPDANGVRQINRFVIPRHTQAKIIKFDQTGQGAEGGFLLNAPPPSQTMEKMKEYSRNWKERVAAGHEPRRRAQVKGVNVRVGTLEGVRDGRGMVHFIPEIPENLGKRRKRA